MSKILKVLIAVTAGIDIFAQSFAQDNVLRVAVLQPMSEEALTSEDCLSPGTLINQSCYYGDTFKVMSALGLLSAGHYNNRTGTYVQNYGDLSGCTLKMDIQIFDAPSRSPNLAVRTLLNLLDSFNPHAVIGASSSGNSRPTSLITGVLDIPQISYWATSKSLDNTANYPRFMRTIPTDDAVAFSICTYWRSLGYEYAGVFFVNDAYGEAFKDSTISHCTALGMENVLSFSFNPTDSEERIFSQVKRLADTGLQIFLLVDYTTQARDIMLAAYEFGILGEGNMWVFAESVYTQDIESFTGPIRKAIDGTIRVFAPGGVTTNARWNQFLSDFPSFSEDFINSFWPPEFQAASSFFEDFPVTDGVTELVVPGAYQYDAVAALGLGACRISPTGPIPSDFGTQFWNLREDIIFEGLTGTVKFDYVGNRDKTTANYLMSNIRAPEGGSVTVEFTARFDVDTNKWVQIPGKNTIFNGGTTNIPTNVKIPEENANWDAQIKFFCRLLGFINLCIACGFLLWTYYNRKESIVRVSQFHFLAMVSLGAIVSTFTILPITIDDQYGVQADENGGNVGADIACNASIWLYCGGFVLTFAPLFAKTWRVKKIFNIGETNKLKRTVVSNGLLLGIVGSLLAVEFTILLIWQIISPLQFLRTVLLADGFDSPLESAGLCQSESSTGFILIIVFLHASVLIYGNYICYQTRSVNSAFSESKYVSIAMFSNLQVLALGIPVLIIVAENPKSNMFIRCGIIFLNDLTVQILIFAPKLMHLHFGYELGGGQGADLVTSKTSKTAKSVTPSNTASTVAN